MDSNVDNGTANKKMSLEVLFERVVAIAMGADDQLRTPTDPNYNPKTAPSVAAIWCASVLRVLILRVVERFDNVQLQVSQLQQLAQNWTGVKEHLDELTVVVQLLAARVPPVPPILAGVDGGDGGGGGGHEGGDSANTGAPEATETRLSPEDQALRAAAEAAAKGQPIDVASMLKSRPRAKKQ